MQFEIFSSYANLTYGFSTRQDGSMHRHTRERERDAYLECLGISPQAVAVADLSHGNNVAALDAPLRERYVPETDALTTNCSGLILSVTGADCFPIYCFDPERGAIGIAHAGWRGIVGGIVPNVVQTMHDTCDTDPEALLVGIGPGIRSCHFSIRNDVIDQFAAYPQYIVNRDDYMFVDLPGIIRTHLASAGVLAEHTEDCGVCTYCEEDRYFSYRRDQPDGLEAHIGYIGLKQA